MHEARLAFRPQETAPAMCRHVLDGLSDRVSIDAIEDARLLTTEVIANAIRHSGLEPDESIVVSIQTTSDDLTIEVADPGPGFERAPPGASRTPRTGGWGLLLLDRIADDWGVRAEGASGSVVWFRLGLDGA